jgi:hypothetical protein
MKIAVIGSGIRRGELELNDCELKDLAYCIQQICAQSFSGKTYYGCTELEILENHDTISLAPKHTEIPRS